MKLATKILSLLVLAAIAVFYISCDGGGGENQSEQEKQFNKLKFSWTLTEANDGTDRTDDFANLVLTLQGSFAEGGTFQYSFTGTRPNPSPWPASGTWKFGANPSTQIIRDPESNDELDLTYEQSDKTLVISFNVQDGHPGWAGSRAGSVSGDWTFTFVKVE